VADRSAGVEEGLAVAKIASDLHPSSVVVAAANLKKCD
jgi:hypothetical protein